MEGEAPGDAGDEVEADDDDAQLPEEGQAAAEDSAVRMVRDPGQPTRDERARHDLTHLPFRPWCEYCVAGKAAADPHRRLVREANLGPPKVSVDYGFVAEGEHARTILGRQGGGFQGHHGLLRDRQGSCRPTCGRLAG